MAVNVSGRPGSPIIEQTVNRPSVYLDTWALDDLSATPELSEKFRSILKEKRGTLWMSWANLYEVTRRSDSRQFEDVCALVGGVDFAFIEYDAHKVMLREEQSSVLPPMDVPRPPHLAVDEISLRAYLLKHNSLGPLSLWEALHVLRDECPGDNHDFGNKMEEVLFPPIQAARDNPTKLKDARSRFRKRKNRCLRKACSMTQYLYCQCTDYIAMTGMNMGANEWRDLVQVIVPVPYSDFALLDSRWLTFLQQAGVTSPRIARVYSKKTLDSFFTDFANFKE